MFVGDAYAAAIDDPAEHAQAAECADLAREFPGWAVTWTMSLGYRAVRDDNDVGPCTSRSAVRALLAVTEFYRMSA